MMVYSPILPQPQRFFQVQWIVKYDGDAEPQLPQLARASPSNSPTSPVPQTSASSPSVAAEGRGAVTSAPASPREERFQAPMLEDRRVGKVGFWKPVSTKSFTHRNYLDKSCKFSIFREQFISN